jgi:glutathione S-transferase
MVLKLYGIYRSPWVRLVAAVLHEKQVPFELVSVDVANKEHKSPEYLANHPFGQIPYIVGDSLFASEISINSNYLDQDDDGFILYESKAICYYIASKYPNQGTPLLPTGIQANALYQQAVFVEFSHFHLHGILAANESIIRE